MKYQEFIESKQTKIINCGFDINRNELNTTLFEYQKDLVQWALKKGRCALFTMTGTGKTAMQAEWAYRVHLKTNKPILMLAPLAVAPQTVENAKELLDIDVKICSTQKDVINGINITNYDKLHLFDTSIFEGVVLDESSILKSFTSSTRDEIINRFEFTPYKLACSATPSPNDYMELGNHSEFLNEMTRKEMLAMYFFHDGGDTAKWRLKGHAQDKFWEWVSTWAAVLTKPSDLGYSDVGFELPELKIHQIVVDDSVIPDGMLFAPEAKTLIDRRNARRNSLDDRCRMAAELANSNDNIWLTWCDLNCESELLKKYIDKSVEVKGSDTEKHKEKSMLDFAKGKIKSLVSKPSICGMGMNFQICNKMIFVGLSDSFEAWFQAVRRCWRFGQKNIVDVYVITSKAEGAVVRNIQRKEKNAMIMIENMVKYTNKYLKENIKNNNSFLKFYNPKVEMIIPEWLESEKI